MWPRFWCLTHLLVVVLAAGCDWPAPRPPGEACRELLEVPLTSINLDGEPDDWDQIQAGLERPAGAGLSASGHALSAFFVAADAKSIYARVDILAAQPPGRGGDVPDAGSQPACGNGSCEPGAGESVLSCLQDCNGSDEQPGLTVFFKVPGYRSGSLGFYWNGDLFACRGHWDGDGEGNHGAEFNCAAMIRADSNPRVVELSVPRSEIGVPVTLFPVWTRSQKNGPPVFEDEIGCVLVRSVSN